MPASMSDPLPPQAIASEHAILAACLWSPEAFHTARRLLSDDDWYRQHHADIWQAMRQLDAAGEQVDASSVHVVVGSRSPEHARLLAELATSDFGAPGSVKFHCEQVVNAANMRAFQVAMRRGLQTSATVDASAVQLAEDVIQHLRLVQRAGAAAKHSELDVHDIAARPDDPEDWVVDGLLARGERLVLTAPEGYGKSTLLRQFAACAAAGVHPFKPQRSIWPRRVYVYDAENPQRINTTEYRRILDFIDVVGAKIEPGALVVEEAGPSNLLDARQAAHLLSQIERIRPDMILIGPLYQLHEENPNDEGPARKLAAVLDRARMATNSALIVEAHTPHSDGPHGQLLRPYGASLWKRWPEFGYCLRPVPGQPTGGEAGQQARMMRESELTPWRGDRGYARKWPANLYAGQRLPWEEA